MSTTPSGGYDLRKLLSEIYPLISKEKKEYINDLIIAINPIWEQRKDKNDISHIGLTKYKLLNTISKEELNYYPLLKNEFQELERKFGSYNDKPLVQIKSSVVVSPLPETAYRKMTTDQWLTSFRKYDDSTECGKPREDVLKGGIIEHSRVFTKYVSKNPDDYFEFIYNLGKYNDISLAYLTAGIRGLVEGKYDILRLKKLINSYWKKNNSDFRKEICKAIEYINNNDNLDLELINILKYYSLNDKDPDKELWKTSYYGNDPLTNGINTVRGLATWCLGIHGFKTKYPDNIFEIMENIANDSSISVRCCLIVFLHGMIQWNKDRTYNLLIKLIMEQDPQIIKYGLQCIYNILENENFNSLYSYIEIAMDLDEQLFSNDRVREFIGKLLLIAYIRNYPNSNKLLQNSFSKYDEIKVGAIDLASKYLLTCEKAKKIYLQFLNEEIDNIDKKYNWSFKRFSPENFSQLYEILIEYSKSKAVKRISNNFFNYISKCVPYEPEKCIDLIENYYDNSKNFDIQSKLSDERQLFRKLEKLPKILIESYNRLLDDDYKEKAITLFDIILKDEVYKYEGIKALSEYDR